MTDDFVTRLQLQLREAAIGQQTWSPRRRFGNALRVRVGLPAAAAALATIAILAAAALLVGVIGGERAVPSRPATPRVLATVSVGQNPYALVAAFGAAWHDGDLYFQSGPATRKARNVAANPACTVSASLPGIDLNGDGELSPIDAILVINYLNTQTLQPAGLNLFAGHDPPIEVQAEGESAVASQTLDDTLLSLVADDICNELAVERRASP